MTREERKRAAVLEKVISIYAKGLRTGSFIKIMFILMVIADAAMVITFLGKNELFNLSGVLLVNSMFLLLTIAIGSDTAQIGDTKSASRNSDTVADLVGGASFTGRFLCTLPFNAKDIINLRLINFEKELAVYSFLTIAIQITLIIAKAMGMQTYDNAIGIAVAVSLIVEVIALIIKLSRFNYFYYMYIGAISAVSVTMAGEFVPGTAEEAADFGSKFGFMSVFSGVSGIVIVIVFAVVISLAGELYLKRKNRVSWHMY